MSGVIKKTFLFCFVAKCCKVLETKNKNKNQQWECEGKKCDQSS